MAIYDLFSKRQKRLRGDVPDVYQYTNLPQNFRVQVVHIVKSTIGNDSDYNTPASQIYNYINNTLCREYGVFKLQEYASENFEYIYNFFLKEKDPEKCLDVIELTFKCINGYVRQNSWEFRDCHQSPDDAIEELNNRFRESGIGNSSLERLSELIHNSFIPMLLNLPSRFWGILKNSQGLMMSSSLRTSTTGIKGSKSVLMIA